MNNISHLYIYIYIYMYRKNQKVCVCVYIYIYIILCIWSISCSCNLVALWVNFRHPYWKPIGFTGVTVEVFYNFWDAPPSRDDDDGWTPHEKSVWLVVWNINFIFPYIGNNHPKWFSYFSKGLKPPTRCVFSFWHFLKKDGDERWWGRNHQKWWWKTMKFDKT